MCRFINCIKKLKKKKKKTSSPLLDENKDFFFLFTILHFVIEASPLSFRNIIRLISSKESFRNKKVYKIDKLVETFFFLTALCTLRPHKMYFKILHFRCIHRTHTLQADHRFKSKWKKKSFIINFLCDLSRTTQLYVNALAVSYTLNPLNHYC